MNGRSCTVQRSLARFYLHRSDMTSLSSQISNLRQAIASTEESWDDSQAIEAINTQFATWDDLVAYADDNRGATKLEEEVEKCRRIQAESEAEVSVTVSADGNADLDIGYSWTLWNLEYTTSQLKLGRGYKLYSIPPRTSRYRDTS